MGGLLGRDNPLGSAFELINKRMEEEAEAEKEKQALTYWNVTKNCLNCTKNLKCNLPRSARNARCKYFEPSEYHLAEIRKHNYEVSLRRRKKLKSYYQKAGQMSCFFILRFFKKILDNRTKGGYNIDKR